MTYQPKPKPTIHNLQLAQRIAKDRAAKTANVLAGITAIFGEIRRLVEAGEVVRIKGFGTFYMAHRAAREGVRFGKEFHTPARDEMAFKLYLPKSKRSG